MTVYLEYVFIENLIMDFIILKETLELVKLKTNNKRIFLASAISTIYVIIMLMLKLDVLNYALSKILLAMCITYIAILPKDIRVYLKGIALFFLVSIINLGTYICIANIFNMPKETKLERALVYIATYYLAKTFLVGLWRMYRTEINKRELNYVVELNISGKLYTYEGFLDTGNTVHSHGLPVIFAEILEEEILDKLINYESFEVKTVTLGNVCTKKAYILEGIKISNNKKSWIVDAGVVFENRKISKLNNYNMVLNYILYTESMGGIKL